MKSWIKLSRRELIAALPITLGRTLFAQPAASEYVEVKTSHGRLRGAKAGNLTTSKAFLMRGRFPARTASRQRLP